jgi:hypothetical protein
MFKGWKGWLLAGLLGVAVCTVAAQEPALVDSLIVQYEKGDYKGNELELLDEIAQKENEPNIKLKYARVAYPKGNRRFSL